MCGRLRCRRCRVATGRAVAPGPPLTRDGVAVALQANIELPEDVAAVQASGAEGVGLYRSEFLLATTSPDALTEDVQFEAYRALLEGVAPGPLTVRTFDVGEEQLLPWPGGGSGAGRPGPGPAGRSACAPFA